MERKPVTGKHSGENQSINRLKSDWNYLYIAGEWVDRGSRPTIKDYDPYTQKIITEVPSATSEDVDKAFEAAERVQRKTMHRTPQEMAQPIMEAINFIKENLEDIVPLLVAESGSTHLKAHAEI